MKKMSTSSPWKSHFSSSYAVTGNTSSSSTTSLHPDTAAQGRTYINLRRGSAPNCQETVNSKSGSGTSKSGGFLSVTPQKARKTSQPDLRNSQGITLSFLGLVAGSKTKQQQSSSSAKTTCNLQPNNQQDSGAAINMYSVQERTEYVDDHDPVIGINGRTPRGTMESDEDELVPVENPTNAAVNFNVGNLKDLLKCVSCHRFLFPPILQCQQGHMECKACFELKSQCGKCHAKMMEVPAKFAEMITEQFKVQCSYSEKGCREAVPFKCRRDHEEICLYKPVQCPEFDCSVTRAMNEIFKHFRTEHNHHFVNAHGSIFNGDIRCDDSNMIMGVERKWAPTMMKLDGGMPSTIETNELGEVTTTTVPSSASCSSNLSGTQHFFLEILRTKHGVWHMWIWYLGEPDEATAFRCEIAIRRKNKDEDSELKYSGRVHSIRIPPHRIILSGCLLSFSDYTAGHFRYLGEGHQGHPVIDYRVSVSRVKKCPSNSERAMAAGLSKMLRRFSIDSGAGKANKPSPSDD